jgi:tetratricopeptide (TPR) repeat protein
MSVDLYTGQHSSLFKDGFVRIFSMNTKAFWLSVVAVLLSFMGGFLLANALNRSEINNLRAENERNKNVQKDNSLDESEITLGDEEIRQRIAEADQNPTNFTFQKNLGIALYRYAAIKQDENLLTESARLLNRVYDNDKKDYDLQVILGNIYFDIGYTKKDEEKFQKAREFYQKALEQKPDDVDVRTDFGLTYFLATPPETETAIGEFQKSLKENPKHEKTLQALTQALLSQNKPQEAEKYLAKLKEVNQNNPAISDLTLQIERNKNNQQK